MIRRPLRNSHLHRVRLPNDSAVVRTDQGHRCGAEPYFSRPVEDRLAYVEFRIGDYQHEFGILDRRFAAPGRSDKVGGAIAYWHVE